MASEEKQAASATGRERIWRIVSVFLLLYVFLLSIQMMGVSFKLFSADFAKNLIETCRNPLLGLFAGILATSLIQSSSTTTSIVVGVVGAGMPVDVAIPIIMGANIGTTITNIIVSLTFVTRRDDLRRAFAGATVHDFFNLCTVVVFFPLELKFHLIRRTAFMLTDVFSGIGAEKLGNPIGDMTKPPARLVAHVLTEGLNLSGPWAGGIMLVLALGALIVAIIYLVRCMRALLVGSAEKFINRWLFRNDFTAFLLGVVMTVAVQSSSVTTSLIVPLVGAGVVTLQRCYPFTLGANIGTTCTALIASLATIGPGTGGEVNTLGVTAAFAHLIFNLCGIAVFYPLRALPIWMAERLAGLAAESKKWAVIFILGVFFGLPALVMFIARLFDN